ncbi:hypothetical protein [Streptomyces sp. AK02-04a]|uniref:hypothetical protein n=1 Tax=Streptomyces sp. AK02-04a TaxID=3028649 RepID=UPI0029B07DBA|nr:hypothetical protein [Streptomyces sp. AK02-04a]MDX3763654.1 hypothetical protein [Streptomyces sp. AK02-04a]
MKKPSNRLLAIALTAGGALTLLGAPQAAAASSADLSVTKTGPTSVAPGEPIDYEVTITNHGPDASSGWTFEELLGRPLEGPPLIQSSDPRCKSVSRPDPTTSAPAYYLVCSGGPLAVGASTTVNITGLPGPFGNPRFRGTKPIPTTLTTMRRPLPRSCPSP